MNLSPSIRQNTTTEFQLMSDVQPFKMSPIELFPHGDRLAQLYPTLIFSLHRFSSPAKGERQIMLTKVANNFGLQMRNNRCFRLFRWQLRHDLLRRIFPIHFVITVLVVKIFYCRIQLWWKKTHQEIRLKHEIHFIACSNFTCLHIYDYKFEKFMSSFHPKEIGITYKDQWKDGWFSFNRTKCAMCVPAKKFTCNIHFVMVMVMVRLQ